VQLAAADAVNALLAIAAVCVKHAFVPKIAANCLAKLSPAKSATVPGMDVAQTKSCR
jgi:hypothetical protein